MLETIPGLTRSLLRTGILATGILAVALAGSLSPAISVEPPSATPAQAIAEEHIVPLTDSDLQAITLEVLKQRPLLSASPGVKYAEASRAFRIDRMEGSEVRPIIVADVIYHPHFDSGGVKQAYEVYCQRLSPEMPWECPDIRIRRYLRVEGQDYETRVTGDIESDVARALVESTRETVRAGTTARESMPDTALMVMQRNSRYVVWWGDFDSQSSVTIEASLRKGGDPRNPQDWETKVFEPVVAE